MAEKPQNSLLGKIAAYTEILATDPRSTIFVSLSEAYRKMGMLDDAYAVAVKGLEHLADYCPGHVVLARIKCQQGDLDGSNASFKRALEIDAECLAALVGFSRLYLLQDCHDEARNLLLKARSLSPADPVINKLLLGLTEVEEAPELVKPPVSESPVVQLEPVATPEPLESATLAELYLQQGLADKALDIFRNLLARDPDNLELRRRIRDLEATADGLENGPLTIAEPEQDNIDRPIATEEILSPGMQTEARAVVVPSGENSVLDQLNRLLTSIQKRRGDVQGHA